MRDRGASGHPSTGVLTDPPTASGGEADWPMVSLIIPVLNDAAGLRRCLTAVAAQTYPWDRLEILVVDNGSHDGTPAVVAEFAGARLLRESRRSSYAARNRGLTAARGEVIAFTDADCVPDPRWLIDGVRALQAAPRAGLVAGRIEVFPADVRRPTDVELLEVCLEFPQASYVRRKQFGATANVFTTRAVLDAVGDFDASLESGGDVEWGQRVAASGREVVYDDRVIVRHPARRKIGRAHV